MMSFIEIKNECKQYQMGQMVINANKDVNFTINKGELAVILGPSGAGKSTLLNLLGGMDLPTSGQIIVDGIDISKFSKKQLTKYRRQDIGFVFQFYNLVPNLTAKENVDLATAVVKDALDSQFILEQVGLKHRLDNFPAQLSGGEQQRVAIARALAKNPKLILADEPTGALDASTGKQVLKLLQNASKKQHQTVLIVTHNAALAQMADRVIYIKDATVKKMVINENPLEVDKIEW